MLYSLSTDSWYYRDAVPRIAELLSVADPRKGIQALCKKLDDGYICQFDAVVDKEESDTLDRYYKPADGSVTVLFDAIESLLDPAELVGDE